MADVYSGDLDRRLLDAVERLGHGVRAMAQRSARTEGLTPLQQQVLLVAARQGRDAPEVGTLASGFDVSAPTVSDAVGALVRKGLVERAAGSDARRRSLTVTPAGREAARRLAGWDSAAVEAFSRVDPTDKAASLAVLLDVIASLSRTGEIGLARTCPSCRFFQPDAPAGVAAEHYCRLLDLPLPRARLRPDCPEYEPAP
jgi:DNA-binding MarR family transcriptional regulator